MGKVLSNFMNRFLASKIKLVIVALLAVAVVVVVVYASGTGAFNVNSNPTSFGLKDIGELATQSGFFTQVDVINDAKKFFNWNIPFTSSKYIFSYDGVIKAGIDFADIEYTADSDTKTVRIHLPEAKILSKSLDEDSLEIYDERQSVFTPLTLTDIQKSRQEMLANIEQTALDNGLLDAANENAKLLVKSFLSTMYSPDVYTYEFE